MAEIYTVYFKMGMEPANARFEFQHNAERLADILHESSHAQNATVVDMERNTVYEPGETEEVVGDV